MLKECQHENIVRYIASFLKSDELWVPLITVFSKKTIFPEIYIYIYIYIDLFMEMSRL